MSSAVRYHPLFRVRIREHGTAKDLPGLRCRPTRRSVSMMRDHRLVFKSRPPGFDVFFAVNPDAGNAILGPITNPIVLSFAMSAESPTVLSRFHPPAEQGQQPQFYLDNLLADGELHPVTESPMSTGPSVSSNDSVRVYPHEFTLKAKDVEGADTLQIRHLITNRVALPQPIALDEEKVDLSGPALDMRKAEPGPYRVAPNTGPGRKIYVDDEMARNSVVAAVDVHWRTVQNTATDAATYVVNFKRQTS